MAVIHVISGFLGSGKTTLIRRLVRQCFGGKKVAIVENDFGDVGIDSAVLQNTGLVVTELNAGCVCCSLVGRLEEAMQELLRTYTLDVIFLEPSGVAQLSDVLRALIQARARLSIEIGSVITLAAPMRSSAYRTKFLGVYRNQLQHAGVILPTHTDNMSEKERSDFLSFLAGQSAGVPVWTGETGDGACQGLLEMGAFCPAIGSMHSIMLRKAAPAHGLSSLTIDARRFRQIAGIEAFFRQIVPEPEKYGLLVRGKGFWSDQHRTCKLDFVLGELTIEPVEVLGASMLVLLGTDLNRPELLALAESLYDI